MTIDIGSLADWAEALTNTVVLVFIYKQLKLMNIQMIQNDDQERSRRSWEFVKFYQEQVKTTDELLERRFLQGDIFDMELDSEELKRCIELFYQPRLRLFTLLEQLLKQQEVEEKLLYGYLIEEFNNFVTLGIRSAGAQGFMSGAGARMSLLMTAWGTQLKARKLLMQ